MSWGKKIFLSGLIVVSLASFGHLSVAQAQGLTSEDLGLQYASSTGLSTQDPRITVAKIIRIVLGFLGTIAVILIIYAGFVWMTSNGNEDKITKAKNILKGAVIGLVIVLSAFAITTFIINSLLEATGGGGSAPPSPPGPPGPPEPSGDLIITGVSPADGASGVPRNTVIRFQFNGSIDPDSVTNASAAVQADDQPLTGQWTVNGREIAFQPASICSSSCGEVNCLPEDSHITVHLTSGIKSLGNNPKNLVCSGLGFSCDLSFSVGSLVDCQDPQAEFLSTIGLCAATNNLVKVMASDDTGLARFEFLANGQQFYLSTNDFGLNYTAIADWQPTSTAGEPFTLEALVDDIAGRRTTIEQRGRLLPAHCCNGQQDADESGLDCGGSCLKCEGAACANDQQSPGTSCNSNLCYSAFCTTQGSSAASCEAAGYPKGTASCCLCRNRPRITDLSPQGGFCRNNYNQYCNTDSECANGDTCDRNSPNAKVGNLITIFGTGFGSSTGSVIFANDKLGDLNVCGNTAWSNNQIIVKVPSGATTGIVQVKNSDNFIATSSQELIINNISRPGLCSLDKASGTTGEIINYRGLNFIQTGVTSTVALYGNLSNPIPANESEVMASNLLKAWVPSLQPGWVSTFVRNDNHDNPKLPGPASNFLLFNKLVDPGSGPQITGFDPMSGPPGQYVTIYGHGFGNIRGNSHVFFGSTEADYNFPEVCATAVWSDRQIIVKVPSGANLEGNQLLSIQLGTGDILEASKLFTVNSDPLAPSLCAIRPTTGQVGTQVEVWGEHFRNYDPMTSRFQFSPNIIATSVSWFDDGTVSGASSTVPAQAISGIVRVKNIQGVSNGLNFMVGACKTNDNCPGQICCPAPSADAGQCRDNLAACYGSASSCVYRWSFTTGSGNVTCPPNTTICGSKCCSADQQCVNNVCTNKTILSCNDYHQCNGALYCPNSPGWCSQKPGSTIDGPCGDSYCAQLFGEQTSGGGHSTGVAPLQITYNSTTNRCISNVLCDLDKKVNFKLGDNTVNYALTCQGKHWTTHLTAGQCPPTTSEYGQWQLLANNVCRSNMACLNCETPLQCLAVGAQGRCGLDEPICASGFQCSNNQCRKEAGLCECCCDKNLNRPDQTNPGCCLPLTCSGTCGSGQGLYGREFGACSGCAAVGPTTSTRDMACNCLGTTGKYCNTSVANGICSDCAQLGKEDCLAHTTCCYDQATSQCRGTVEGNRLVNGYCGYYVCNNNKCIAELQSEGQFTTLAECQASCQVVNLQGESCNVATTTFLWPNYINHVGCGYQLCASPFNCRTASGLSSTSTNQADCGICCCDPAHDQCSQVSPNLYCDANRDQCSGANRGLCCGCERDEDCGSIIYDGCGQDSCCRARPYIVKTVPDNEAQQVCRNSLIDVEFSKTMAATHLEDNIFLIADYGQKDPCPTGTTYLAAADLGQGGWWVKLKNRLLTWFRPDVAAEEGILPDNTYCALPKSIELSGKHLTIHPANVLPANRRIYVVMRADNNLQDSQPEGILDQNGIGLANGKPLQFGNLELPAALYWSFKTSDQVCRVDHVELNPTSILFSDLQASSTIEATAVDFNGQILEPYPSYNWQWLWSIGNPAVAQLVSYNGNRALLRPQNKKDAETYVEAIAQVTADQTAVPGALLPSFSKTALIRVFLCANPWPARRPDGSWQPWTDSVTNMQFYYCRDREGSSQAGDLPALKVVTSTDPGAMVPAFYFFHYSSVTSSPTNLVATPLPAGGKVGLRWDAYPNASGYKVYYGLNSGQYFVDPIITTSTQVTIDNLINGQLYYFAVSALIHLDAAAFAETPFSAEVQARPQDIVPPSAVHCFERTDGEHQINLVWNRNQDDTVRYRVEYRIAASPSESSQILLVSQPASGNKVRTSITNLINPKRVIVNVYAVDAAGNVSPAQLPYGSECNK